MNTSISPLTNPHQPLTPNPLYYESSPTLLLFFRCIEKLLVVRTPISLHSHGQQSGMETDTRTQVTPTPPFPLLSSLIFSSCGPLIHPYTRPIFIPSPLPSTPFTSSHPLHSLPSPSLPFYPLSELIGTPNSSRRTLVCYSKQ